MPRKCSVGGYDPNFDSERKKREVGEKIPVYGFPEDRQELSATASKSTPELLLVLVLNL